MTLHLKLFFVKDTDEILFKITDSCPSILKKTLSSLDFILIFIFKSHGIIKVLIPCVCGHIGVISNTFRVGNNTGPPADNEYAVEPVGVEKITPSAINDA